MVLWKHGDSPACHVRFPVVFNHDQMPKTTKKLNDQTTRADIKFDPNPHKKNQQKAASLIHFDPSTRQKTTYPRGN